MAGEINRGLASIYAEALYGAAKEDGVVETTEQELLTLQEIFQRDVRIRRFIETPAISEEVKRKVLCEVMSAFSKTTLNFLCLLIHKQRIKLLDHIISAFHTHCNREGGIAELELHTASPLDAAQKLNLKTILEKKLNRTVILKILTRPTLIGGFILKHEDLQWDSSLVDRLGRIVSKMEACKPGMGAWAQEA